MKKRHDVGMALRPVPDEILGSDAGNLGGRFLAPILALRCGGFPAAILELRRGGSTSACRWRRRRR